MSSLSSFEATATSGGEQPRRASSEHQSTDSEVPNTTDSSRPQSEIVPSSPEGSSALLSPTSTVVDSPTSEPSSPTGARLLGGAQKRHAFRREFTADTIAGRLKTEFADEPIGLGIRSAGHSPRNGSISSFRRYGGASGAATPKKRSQYDHASTRLAPGTELEKPWAGGKSRLKYARYIVWFGCILGCGLAGMIIYFKMASVPKMGSLELIFEDNFATLDTTKWNHELTVGNSKTGVFDAKTNSSDNSFVEDGVLYLVPTLTQDYLSVSEITNGYTTNLTAEGICTGDTTDACVISSNSTVGTIVNPVRSARLNTKGTVSLKYGRVEVVAKMPKGDWIWPLISLLPVNDTYGAYPASGEIEVMQSRGNDDTYKDGGRDVMSSVLHWGPYTVLDRFERTTGQLTREQKDFSEAFYTFAYEWTPDYMMFWVESRVHSVSSINTKSKSFWERGDFPSSFTNGSTNVVTVTNPWITSDNNVAPFDQDFYLALDLSVGGTNGYFPDGVGSKPWSDADDKAMLTFYEKQSVWNATWGEPKDRALAVKSVKIWQSTEY